MSVKLRQFTTADGQTIYVKMSRKEYKETLKKAQNGEEIDLKDKSVFQSKKGDVSRAEENLTQNDAFYDSSLEIGSDKMETKKDYKARQKQYEQALKDHYVSEGMTEKEAAKIAKAEAKERIEAEKAADEVITAEYFTPDQKDEYKAKKKELEAQGKHAVLLTDDDMKRMEQFDELKGFVQTDEKGKKTIADQDGLKKAAAKLVGDDNKLSYEERFDLTRDAKSSESFKEQLIEKYKKEGMSEEDATKKAEAEAKDHAESKMSHGSARITKNMFKHLGFDHAHDYTETLIAGGVAAAAAGAGIGAAVVTGGAAGATFAGGALGNVGGIAFAGTAGAGHALTGLAIGSGVGASLGAGALFHKKDPVEIKIKQDEVPPTPTPTPVPTPTPTPTPVPTPTPTPTPVPTTPSNFRGRAVDEGIKARRKVKEDDWKAGTNPMQKSDAGQYVLANEKGEVETTGNDYKKPDTITFHDNTNDPEAQNVNSYTYRKITPEEIEAGKLSDGTEISIGNRDKSKDFYVLVSADKKDGTDIKATHAEVYELNYEEDGEGENMTGHYDLRQYEGMSGYNVSSNDYSKRGTEGNGGANFKWGNWARQDKARQNKIASYNAQSAKDLTKHLQPAPALDDLIKANPSVFDADGNVKANADWSKLDLPKGTVFLN